MSPSSIVRKSIGAAGIAEAESFMQGWKSSWDMAAALDLLDRSFRSEDAQSSWDRGAYDEIANTGAGFLAQLAHARACQEKFWELSLWRVPEARVSLGAALKWLAESLEACNARPPAAEAR